VTDAAHWGARAATIDELLSDQFEALPGQKVHVDLAARRLANWCRSAASGDWPLFGRRLHRDGLSMVEVLARFATVRRRACASTPAWMEDAVWIQMALESSSAHLECIPTGESEPCAFEHLLEPVIEAADARLWERIEARAADNLKQSARAGLRCSLRDSLSELCAVALYERFEQVRNAHASINMPAAQPDAGNPHYRRFLMEMRATGFRRLFADKPVLLRLIASVTRQWIETARELIERLDKDLALLRQELLGADGRSPVAQIASGLSDRHNGGRSAQLISFENGTRVVYKPKDLRVDARWHRLIEQLNQADPPVALKSTRVLSREGYGWAEFVHHAGCAAPKDFTTFFRRAGAWLALFHCFAASDIHQENIIAAGDHPVPIDLEMILQATAAEHGARFPEEEAFAAATQTIANSVSVVGLLPVYVRSPESEVLAMGGMISNRSARTEIVWENVNADRMRPRTLTQFDAAQNLPHINGHYARFGDHIADFMSGFEDYSRFLLRQSRDALFDGFAGLPVRKLIRPTRFYYLLLHRLKDHRTMDDGPAWAAQADFVARLADWDTDSDLLWPLHQSERAALLELNVPHFVSATDSQEIGDSRGISICADATLGLDRARARMRAFDAQEISWQIEVIRHNTDALSKSAVAGADNRRILREVSGNAPPELFLLEANGIAAELCNRAIRRGPGAAWIGVDWLGDTEVSQLVALGPDLYNGISGIAVFFAAHAATTQSQLSRELALAAIALLRKNLKSRSAARFARSLGIGGATGLGSIVYALTLISSFLHEPELLADAHVAAELFSDDLIAADRQLDVLGGSAGAVLALLRLYQAGQSPDALRRAIRCGEHLLAQPRMGPQGRRSWGGQGSRGQPLGGMAHGAAGFAYALSALFAATGREGLMAAASECIAFENGSYDPQHGSWRDLRHPDLGLWPCQWCHGAVGTGLARVAMMRLRGSDFTPLAQDIARAVAAVEGAWPNGVDTLCCGTLGSIELLYEAGRALKRCDLGSSAAGRLMSVVASAGKGGDYQWNVGTRQFNPGLFRGLAGTGYTLLRRLDDSLPNLLVWE
jgi:type 2 lantibiotic biosynthesis protein LanM